MSVETVRFIGPIFVVAASIVSILMVIIGAAADLDRVEREGGAGQ